MADVPERADLAVLVLAGDRGPSDPVAASRGYASKALVPVAGRAMLTRVLDAVAMFDADAPIVLVAPQTDSFRAAADNSSVPAARVRWVVPAGSPSRSVARALDSVPDRGVTVLVTADHPLLDPAWLHRLVSEAHRQDADVAAALVPWPVVEARFATGRRTRYRFRDVTVCGTNLFAFRSRSARRMVTLWQRVEADRKRPWRIVSLLGIGNLARYLLGGLTLDAALAALSRRVGVHVHAVLLDDAESAVDVDSVADLQCVEEIIGNRSADHVQG
jgi:GTP:adenosylcobinamide-phosphate guanylyltransferase